MYIKYIYQKCNEVQRKMPANKGKHYKEKLRMLQMISGMILKDKAKSELILKMICVEPLKGIFEKSNTEVVWACKGQKKLQRWL